ncbi:LacI family DNA-binding transcriptional regulator [Acetanaerobacterium elongatum]|uniref:Transcriptional regulator, LacI family n=1 Tax=Acetanaerobacterium elongatum TaxID=258515 RepID=A0A1G9TZI9_9FIRM|nr:LacI family DNA-binding transcriptional regulator [Acetanaerobacterium elongatum]SDM53210.1 transcriptional regulator, LacI family [Acetanaerobacterium elongatum]
MKSEDIARLAGVSRSTVSRVINNYPNVPPETREKVMRIITEMGYEPNNSAQILAGKANNTLGLFVVSIYRRENIYQNSYYSSIVNAAVDAANSCGYYVLIHTIYSEADYCRIFQTISQKRISGGIIVGNEKDTEQIKKLIQTQVPVGIVDFDPNRLPENDLAKSNLVVVNSSDYESAIQAVNYLYKLGHREIGIITGRPETYTGLRRYQGYLSAMNSLGLKVNESFVLRGSFQHDIAYQQTLRLIDGHKLPTALVSCSDDMAIAAIKAFKERGIKVPQELSIVSFDNSPMAAQFSPQLTTFEVPLYDMVTRAAELVIGKIEGSGEGFESESFPLRFIERQSCAPKGM